jgi:hypothetical protein
LPPVSRSRASCSSANADPRSKATVASWRDGIRSCVETQAGGGGSYRRLIPLVGKQPGRKCEAFSADEWRRRESNVRKIPITRLTATRLPPNRLARSRAASIRPASAQEDRRSFSSRAAACASVRVRPIPNRTHRRRRSSTSSNLSSSGPSSVCTGTARMLRIAARS